MDLCAVLLDDLGVLSQAREPVADVVPLLRSAGLRTAVLSNADDVRPGLPEVDAVLVSGRTGLRKPDLRAFVHAARTLGVEPAQCVLVDDAPANVQAAAAAGCVGVLHLGRVTTLAELDALLGLRATIPAWPTA